MSERDWDDPYCRLYRRIFRPAADERACHEPVEISTEMRAVVEAPHIQAAAEVIEWWGSFSGRPAWNKSPRTVAKHIRQTWARMNR